MITTIKVFKAGLFTFDKDEKIYEDQATELSSIIYRSP